MSDDLRLDQFLPYRLSVASNLASSAIAQAYVRLFGLSIGEWRVLALLAERPSASQQDLVAASRMDKMSISRAVTALVLRGLVARAPHASDKRAWTLTLTRDGAELYARIVPAARALEAELLADLTVGERAMLDTVLRKIEAAALGLTNS